ncbi:MAG: Ig-like domain-containing protein [archaeon]|nr:Ig-like domain-containing protein [archaeon]
MISKGGFFIKTNKILIALIVLLVGCMVVGAASAANTDDIAVSDLNANPDDSYMQLNLNSDYDITITANDIEEGSNATIQFNVTNKARHGTIDRTAHVTFKIGDKESGNVSLTRYSQNTRASCTYTFENLTVGQKTVTVKFYSSTNDNNPNVVNKTFNVIPVVPVETNIVINNVRDLKVNEKNLFIYATEENGVEGSYVFLLNGASVISSENMVQIMGLPAGEYCLQAFFTPKDSRHYLFSSTEANFTVTKYDVDISVEVDPVVSVYELGGNTVTAVAKFLPGHYFPINQTVLFSLDVPQWFEAPIYYVDGIPYANFTFDKLGAGEYTVFVKYTEDYFFNDSNGQANFTINKADPELILEVFGEHPNVKKDGSNQDFGVYVKDNIFFFANLPADATGYVEFSLDGIVWYRAPVVDGRAEYEFGELPAGEYTLYAKYSGDDNYNPTESNTTFTVESPSPYVHDEPVEPVVPTMANTGNPLLVLFIALAGLGIGSLRRKL